MHKLSKNSNQLINNYGHIVCASLIMLIGFLALTPTRFYGIRFYHGFHITAHFISIYLGFLLLYLSLQLYRRKRIAFVISLFGILGLLIISVTRRHFGQDLLYLFTAFILLLNHKQFYVKSNNLNLKYAILMSIVVLVGAFGFGAIKLYLMNKREFNHDFTVYESIKYVFLQFLSLDNGLLNPATRQARFFLHSLDFIGLTTLFIIIANLFKPVKFVLFFNKKDNIDAKNVILKNSASTEDFFKLWPQDKHYFFNKSHTGVIAYQVQSGNALVLGGPVGNKQSQKHLLKSFKKFCNQNGWSVSILHADQKMKVQAEHSGFSSVFIGNEAVIDIDEFIQSTIKSKHFRYIENKAKREDLVVEIWPPKHSKNQLAQLRKVSDSWLQLPGRREYTFIMGVFSEEYLNQCDIAVLKQHNKVIAYVNVIPGFLANETSIDHMRHLPDIPSVGMHYLLKELINSLSQRGYKEFNLGLSLLAGIDEINDPNINERILLGLKTIGSYYYSFDGIEQFKSKFKPKWQPRYLLYEGRSQNLLKIIRAISKATSSHKPKPLKKKVLLILSFVAGLSYVNFLIALPLGISTAEFVSSLQTRGASYGWFFILADVVSGVIITYFAYLGTKESTLRKNKLIYILFAIGGVCNVLATLAPVRGSSHTLHAIFSAVSVISFYGAIITNSFTEENKKIKKLTIGLVTFMIILGAVGAMMQTEYRVILQQLQLAYLATYIIILCRKVIQ